MKRLHNPLAFSIILTLLLAVTSLALTPTPTIEPTPTSNPQVTAKTADGGSVIVEDGKVYKIDASGAKTETELSKEVFTDVFEAGDLVKQLHPEYFGEDQSSLKNELLPRNVESSQAYRNYIQEVVFFTPGDKSVGYFSVVGKVVDVCSIEVNTKMKEGVALLAVYGSRNPVPIPLVSDYNNKVSFLSQDVMVNERIQFGNAGIWGKSNEGLKSFNSGSYEGILDFFKGKILGSTYVYRINKPDIYEMSGIFQVGLSNEEIGVINESTSYVTDAYLEYKTKKQKGSNAGGCVDILLSTIREKHPSVFSGFFPYWMGVGVVKE